MLLFGTNPFNVNTAEEDEFIIGHNILLLKGSLPTEDQILTRLKKTLARKHSSANGMWNKEVSGLII